MAQDGQTEKLPESGEVTDREVHDFFDRVERLEWEAVEPVPQWAADEATRFASLRPRPDPHELRMHIDHAIAVARGWDHPDRRDLMFHTAVKSFYMLRWLDYLQKRADEDGATHVDLSMAVKISFNPKLRKAEGDEKKQSEREP